MPRIHKALGLIPSTEVRTVYNQHKLIREQEGGWKQQSDWGRAGPTRALCFLTLVTWKPWEHARIMCVCDMCSSPSQANAQMGNSPVTSPTQSPAPSPVTSLSSVCTGLSPLPVLTPFPRPGGPAQGRQPGEGRPLWAPHSQSFRKGKTQSEENVLPHLLRQGAPASPAALL